MAEDKKVKKKKSSKEIVSKKAQVPTGKKSKKSKVVEAVSFNLPAKYRPLYISDMVGQDTLVSMVKGWSKTGLWPSTILVEGNTGSGKTTVARIIAMMVNCKDGTGCGNCSSCKLYLKKGHPDLNEYNMGDVGKVDDMRNLIRTSDFAPRYKKRVILLDESHAMTKQAASALLVPTEEPPAHVMWIFCTTDAHKMLDTIRNRCITLSVKPIETEVIRKRLVSIVKEEGMKIKDKKEAKKALGYIAEFSEGQMRKGISQLQAIMGAVYAGEKFDYATVIKIYSQSGEAGLDEDAVRLLGALLCHDLVATMKYTVQSGNPRALLSKLRWLLTYVINKELEINKFTPVIGKVFDKLAANLAKNKEKKKSFAKGYNLPNLLAIQHALCEVEWRWNQCSIPEEILLQTSLAQTVVNDYKFSEK